MSNLFTAADLERIVADLNGHEKLQDKRACLVAAEILQHKIEQEAFDDQFLECAVKRLIAELEKRGSE